MPRIDARRTGAAVVLLFVAAASAQAPASAAIPPKFTLAFDPAASDKPYTGRVYVATTQRPGQDPLDATDWFKTEPFFAIDVKGWKPGEPLTFDAARTLGYPKPLAELPPGEYRGRAAIDLNGFSGEVIKGPGNGVSEIIEFEHSPERPADVKFVIDQRLPQWDLKDTADRKYARVRSELLSKFYGRDVTMHAAVDLPDSYDDGEARRFPTVYTIPGFGGTIEHVGMLRMYRGMLRAADFDAVIVYLDPDSPNGHHVFADSANNGPRGQALIEELIPYLEKNFRLIAEPDARFVTGISSGGWSSLWLQVTYPDYFGGVWSCSPDPVDFRAFQIPNIYDPSDDFLYEPDGAPRLSARAGMFRRGGLTTLDEVAREEVVGRAQQYQAFDAVFGPRGPDGRAVPLWDRKTGKVDLRIAEAWKRYDIRMILEGNWQRLGPKLKSKLYLYCGDRDDFFLDRAFVMLRDALARLGSDAFIDYMSGVGHFVPPFKWPQIGQQMKAQFERRYESRAR
jgi:S-formylglutathione hydrolase FrmB